MSMHDRSAVTLSRSADQSSVVLTATVTPPEAASNLRWSKTGEGFDIVPSGTSCTVNGNNSFEGYDAHGQVTAKVDTSGTITGSQDTCDVSVVKDKGNLCDPGEFSTATKQGVTLTRTIANKYTFSGSPTYGDEPSLRVTYAVNSQSLSEGVYSLAKSDLTHLGSNVAEAQVQFYSVDGGNIYRTNSYGPNAALTDAQFSLNLHLTCSGGDVSGYIVPFLSKVPDSGQLIEGHDLSADASDWAGDGPTTTVSFSGTDAVFVAPAADSRITLSSSVFTHNTGDVYAIFIDAYSDDVSSIKVGPVSSPATVNITSTKKRYGALYTSNSDRELSIAAGSAGTIHVSNVKLVKVTDTSSFDSFATLDEPRIEPLFL